MTTIRGLNILTNTRIASFKACRERHRLRYECGITKDRESTSLRFGSMVHKALEALANHESIETTCEIIHDNYSRCPEYIDEFDWAIEREEVIRLVCGYHWRWEHDNIEYVAAEHEFDVAVINPKTGAASRTWRRSGKIDSVIRRGGPLLLKETKTTSESLDADSDYWPRLAIDSQIIGYVEAARDIYGWPISGVLYDVIRKPSISPSLVPERDDFGLKIVLDANGNRVTLSNGKPRQLGDKEKGWTLQCRRETPQEYGDRLTSDIGERPEFYYARRVIGITDHQIEKYRRELWDVAKDMREGEVYTNTAACKEPWPCEFQAICFNNIDVTPDGPVPEGFKRLGDVHPELTEKGENNDDINCPTETATA